MRIDRKFAVLLCAALGMSTALILVGCSGGNGPTLPSPDGDGAGDVVETEDFVVGPRETVRYDTDTVIECDSARIEGQVIGADGAGPGDPGCSITIAATGDVEVTGTVRAGNGGQSQDTPDSVSSEGDQTTGGDGGSITITSAEGDISIGASAGADMATAQLPAAHLIAGDGGPGGSSYTGGPGGSGGDIVLNAPNGRVALAQQEGLIQKGDGADGGEGYIPPEDTDQVQTPDGPTAHGGDGGRMRIRAAVIDGLIAEGDPPILFWVETEGMIAGGNGGDGGPMTIGGTAGTSGTVDIAPTGRQFVGTAQDDAPATAQSGNGGSATAPGTPGDGADCFDGRPEQPWGAWGTRHAHALSAGGRGGDLGFDQMEYGAGGEPMPILAEGGLYVAGSGGASTAIGADRGPAVGCLAGASGGDAWAEGGAGGQIDEALLSATIVNVIRGTGGQFRGGAGGPASARGGTGGPGGDCCEDVEGGAPGGKGGDGGSATAVGGMGGDQALCRGGAGGHVSVHAPGGGDGGDGNPPGGGGALGATDPTPGDGGTGSPQGQNGAIGDTTSGSPGSAGDQCPEQPGPAEEAWGLFHFRSGMNSVTLDFGWFEYTLPTQAPPALGGPNNPLEPNVGQSLWIAPDNSVMWVATFAEGVKMYSDPLSGGDRAPDVTVGVEGVHYNSVWVDTARDVLYASTNLPPMIHAWDNASAMTAARAPDRITEMDRGLGVTDLAGGAGDTLYAIWTLLPEQTVIAVLENASNMPAQVDPPTIDTGAVAGYGLACDPTRDVLYVARDSFDGIDIVLDASTASGVVVPTSLTGPATGLDSQILGLRVDPATNLLFSGADSGHVSVWTGASALDGDVAPDKREKLAESVHALAVFKQ